MSLSSKFEIIEENEMGVVAMCDECDNIHIEIGAFTSVVSQKSFEDICRYLKSRKRYANELIVETPTSEKILVPVSNNIFLSLTLPEFRKVVDLFEMALHMLTVKRIIQL